MYAGRHPAITPLTATFHTVARRRSGRSSQLSRRAGRRSAGTRRRARSRRHDRQAVAPVVLVEEAIDLVEVALEDDVGGGGLDDRGARARGRLREVRITASTVTATTLRRSSSMLCTSMWPGTSATAIRACRGRCGGGRLAAEALAHQRRGRHAGRSATALARNTAGVQLPQQAIPEMTASTSSALSLAGSSASTRCSSRPWVEPNAS